MRSQVIAASYQVIAARCQVVAVRRQVIAVSYQVIAARCQVVGVRCQVIAVRCQVVGVRFQVIAVRCQVVGGGGEGQMTGCYRVRGRPSLSVKYVGLFPSSVTCICKVFRVNFCRSRLFLMITLV